MMQKLFHGKNRFLSLRAAHQILKIEFKESELVSIDAQSMKAERIIDLLYSPSLFTLPKIYYLKRPYKNKDREILLTSLLDILPRSTINLIIWEDQKIRSNTKYYKFFQQKKAVEEFPELNKRTFITWAKEEVDNQTINLNTDILNLLSQRSNYDPERFVNNLKKLQLLETPIIDREILDEVVADTLETDIWKLMDSINSGDSSSVNQILDKLLEYRVDPNYILAMIARNLRLSIQIKYLIDEDIDQKKFSSILKLPPFAVYPIIKAVRKINKDKICLQYRKLSNLDYEIKTGRIDPVLGLSLFTLVL